MSLNAIVKCRHSYLQKTLGSSNSRPGRSRSDKLRSPQGKQASILKYFRLPGRNRHADRHTGCSGTGGWPANVRPAREFAIAKKPVPPRLLPDFPGRPPTYPQILKYVLVMQGIHRLPESGVPIRRQLPTGSKRFHRLFLPGNQVT
jgi:hypothetical protein